MSEQEDREKEKEEVERIIAQNEAKLTRIITQGVTKTVLATLNPRPAGYDGRIFYRNAWADVIKEMLDALDEPNSSGSSEIWKQLPEEQQDKVAEIMKFSFLKFLNMMDELQDALILKQCPTSLEQ